LSMIRCRFLVTLILTLSPILSLSQTVAAQGYFTSTITTMITNSRLTIVTVRPSVTTSTTPESQPIFSSSITLEPSHGGCGSYFEHPFNATAGEDLSVTLSADSQVDFYVMAATDFQAWSLQMRAGGACSSPTPLLSQRGTTAFNFTSRIANNGTYQMIVNNLSNSTVTTNLTATLYSSIPIKVTVVNYSTLAESNVQTLTLITLLTSPEENPSQNSTLIVSGGTILIILILIAFLVFRRRPRTKLSHQATIA